MRRHRRIGILSVVCCAALIAASCGDDDDGGTGAETEATEAGTEATEAETEATEAETEATEAETEATEAETGDTEAPDETAGGGGGPPVGEDGEGAEEWAAALEAAETSPLAADDSLEPFVIGLPNLEGEPAGTFPDVGEGAQAAVQFINEKLGGIGADLEAGTPGRPIELMYCAHQVDQNEAQACANEIAGANPNVVMIGVDFFTPLMYPLFADFPVVETLPIFIADFDQPGVVSPFGGCPTAFPSSAQMIAEIKEHDRLAVIWDQNAPGEECWRDTQERFYQHYADTMENFEFQGFPTTPGETAGQPAVIQQVSDYLDGAENPAIYFGIAAAECARVHHGPRRRRRRGADLHRRLMHQ